MKQLTLLAIAALSLCGCNDSYTELAEWEFGDYDHSRISASFDYQMFVSGQIAADADYSGELLMTCTNYPMVDSNFGQNKFLGIKVEGVNPNTVKVLFSPVDKSAVQDSSIMVSFTVYDGKGMSSYSNFNFSRK